jgi:hypothetical protein
MADRVLFVSWGMTARGREERGLEVFNESVGLYGRMQQDGKIEGFDVCLMDPNGTLDGYVQVRGSAEQLATLMADEEWRRNMADASLIVDDLRVTGGSINEGVARDMALYQEAIGKVPQSA